MTTRRFLAICTTVLATGVIALQTVPSSADQRNPLAPMMARGGGSVVSGQYLVVLTGKAARSRARTAALKQVMSSARAAGGEINYTYRSALPGFSATLPPAALDAVRRDPHVAWVQPNKRHVNRVGYERRGTSTGDIDTGDDLRDLGVQENAPFQLDRIDQRDPELNGTYDFANDAQGVDVYVVDSGIRATHDEFEGRVVSDFTSIEDGRGTDDCNGHGTFVASHVGGKTFGVAKKATLHSVRILGCDNSGTTEQIVAGMDFVAQNHVTPAVVNMSIESDGGATDPAMDAAAARLIDSGVILVLITGNFNKNDCENSPKDPRAIIAAATDRNDSRNTGTNPSSFGPCTTVFAPGADVSGAGIDSDDDVQENFFGTSFAAPLVTGTVALAIKDNPGLSQAEAKDLIVSTSTRDVLSNVGDSPNRLLFSRLEG